MYLFYSASKDSPILTSQSTSGSKSVHSTDPLTEPIEEVPPPSEVTVPEVVFKENPSTPIDQNNITSTDPLPVIDEEETSPSAVPVSEDVSKEKPSTPIHDNNVTSTSNENSHAQVLIDMRNSPPLNEHDSITSEGMYINWL